MEQKREKGTIQRILVPIDFSDYSLNACYFALHLSSRHDAEIILFHAFFNPMVDAMTFPDAFTYQSNLAEVFHEIEQNARKELDNFTDKLERYSNLKNLEPIKIRKEVAAGQPGDEIRNIVKAFKPEIIITGTHGHGKKTSEVLGSVASRVIDYEGVPVLLVTRDAVLREDKQIKVLYATNFDNSDYKAVESLMNIMEIYNFSIDCVHFTTGTSRNEHAGDLEKMSEMEKHFKKFSGSTPLNCHVIESRDILGGLDEFVEKHDIDLISMTHKKRNLFYRLLNPSLAKKLLFKTKRPVFIFN